LYLYTVTLLNVAVISRVMQTILTHLIAESDACV